MNGIDYLDRGWRTNPSTPCLVDAATGASLTYDEVRTQTFRIGNALRDRGYATGGKGAILAYNEIGAFVVYLAFFRLGMAPITINVRNAIPENASILDAMDCEILFYSQAFAHAIDEVRRLAPRVREYVCIDAQTADPSLDRWIGNATSEYFDIPHDPNRLLLIQPTGGTTGKPKGTMVAHRGMEHHVASLMAVAPCDIPPVFLAVAPLTHAAGYVMQSCLCLNGTGVLMSKPDKSTILRLIEERRVTHTFLPPTLIYELLEHPDVSRYDYSSLRYLLYGASPMAPEKLRRAMEVFGPVMSQVFGQSETAFPNTFMSPQDHLTAIESAPERLSSCGKSTPLCVVEIMSDGQLLPDGEIGEIVIRSSGLMLGYYNEEEGAASTTCNGWHLTGDVGYRDSAGYFYIVDRKKDMIITGGFVAPGSPELRRRRRAGREVGRAGTRRSRIGLRCHSRGTDRFLQGADRIREVAQGDRGRRQSSTQFHREDSKTRRQGQVLG